MPDRTAATTCLLALITTFMAIVPFMRPASTQARVLAIVHVNVVDVVDGRIVPNSTVIISGDTITGVTPNGAAPDGAQVVEGKDKFIVPGLWDMHAHMQATGESWLQLNVANGVTGIRDMGSDVERHHEDA